MSSVWPAFLAALERPDSFVAANIILRAKFNLSTTPTVPSKTLLTDDGADHTTPEGLRVALRFTIPRPGLSASASEWIELICAGDDSVRIDPAQLPAIRRYWHDRLDVRRLSVPYAPLIALLLLLPGNTAIRSLRRRRRVRQGLCPQCGYDLRESSERCPECAHPIDGSHTKRLTTFARRGARN